MNVNVKVIKCRNSMCRKPGFSHVLEQYVKNKETTGLCINNNNSVKKDNTKMVEDMYV